MRAALAAARDIWASVDGADVVIRLGSVGAILVDARDCKESRSRSCPSDNVFLWIFRGENLVNGLWARE